MGRGVSYLTVPHPPPAPASPLVSFLTVPRPPPTPASPLVSYLTVPRPPPTPVPPLVGEPIVEVYNIKTHNFYEIKVDF